MYTLIVFLIVIAAMFIIGLRFRVPPFILLVGGAIFYGIAIGLAPEKLFEEIPTGLASVFEILAIPILAGSVMAKYLVEQDQVQEILSDLKYLAGKPFALAGISGFFLSPPTTCPVTTFMVESPVFQHLVSEGEKRSALLYTLAIGATLGTAFFYPTPVTYSLFALIPTTLSPIIYDLVAIPLGLLLLSFVVLYFRKKGSDENIPDGGVCLPSCTVRFHLRAWAPFIALIASIPVGWVVLHLQHYGLIQFIMLVGMITAVIVARPDIRHSGFLIGAKHAGVIIFDICGAGALGYVITQSTFANDTLQIVSNYLPLLIFPFILAMLIQTAQGSRIVTSIITANIIAANDLQAPFNPLALFLMISAGACILAFVTDPLFWVLHRTTGDDVKTVFRYYTVPQVILGVIVLGVAVLIQTLYPV